MAVLCLLDISLFDCNKTISFAFKVKAKHWKHVIYAPSEQTYRLDVDGFPYLSVNATLHAPYLGNPKNSFLP